MTIVLLPTLPDEKNGIFKRSYVNSNNMSILTQAFCILGPFVLASGWHTGIWCQFCSTSWVSTVQFSRSVMSNSLWPHILQHASPSCPSPTPGAYSNSCPSSQWCHPSISSFVGPFFSRLPSFPAAAAKSLQSCPTLCDSIDGSPPGSPVPGILQARVVEWVAISFSKAWKWKVKVKSLSHVWLLATPWTAAYQAPPFMGFSRQEYWSIIGVL